MTSNPNQLQDALLEISRITARFTHSGAPGRGIF